MGDPVTINIRHLSRGLGIQLGQVQAVLELLDEGNTVPFITRYRKDQTGGLDEEKIRQIEERLEKMRLLAERKQTILRSIESQGKLTEELDKRIRSANTAKRLEDLYLPYKPKKQTLAQLAQGRGLEKLADEIVNRDPNCADLDRRAADFVNPDRGVPTAAEALLGAGHILAERISENVELRQRLREIIQRTGRVVTCRAGSEEKTGEAPAAEKPQKPSPEPAASETDQKLKEASSAVSEQPPTEKQAAAAKPPAADATESATSQASAESVISVTPEAESANGDADVGHDPQAAPRDAAEDAETPATERPPSVESGPRSPEEEPQEDPEDDQPGSGIGGGPDGAEEKEDLPDPTTGDSSPEASQPQEQDPPISEAPPSDARSETLDSTSESSAPETVPSEANSPQASESGSPGGPPTEQAAAGEGARDTVAKPETPPQPAQPKAKRKGARKSNAERKAERKRQKKKKAEEKKRKAFSDYFDYSEELRKIPPHRVLAINRGDRGKVLRVKLESDQEAMNRAADELSVPEDHPHAEFLRGCTRDALARLILPSLERETRRELTERAEAHAVGVFAKNLRNLLLQPPVRGKRVLAVDPGFKSGCKLVALDQFGNVLAQAVIYLIGKPERKEESKATVKELMERFRLSVVAIGNGTACREAEDFFAEVFAEAPAGAEWAYVIVNEAGASVYSTSSLGREEFPEYDATVRGAISIGRRLQDPLSELVKIDPANIGVGLYQHDVKAKHLRESLDHVVGSCVNFVGVDVNTASPALLRYVSGMNQLTARRVYEHRMQNGPFRNREQLRGVTGFGEATFVQAAGFLKIVQGDNPLDSSWIHPESYEIACRVLERLGCRVESLRSGEERKALSQKIAEINPKALAGELGVGELLLRDILAQLMRPGRDPREDLPPPIFRQGVLKLEDLTPGMELSGTVLNVVDFGVFVDIGMHDSGLVHVSQLADRFVRDPHEVAAVGDIVKVWVLDVDKQRRRVSLTMIPPGTSPAGSSGKERSERRGGGRSGGKGKQSEKPREQQGTRGRGRGRGGEGGERGGRGRGRGGKQGYKPKSRPKPVTPITKDMKEGREPMRSFSDLAQFFGTTEAEPESSKKSKKKQKGGRPKEDEDKKSDPASLAEESGQPKDAPSASADSQPDGPREAEGPGMPPPSGDSDDRERSDESRRDGE